jgi:hypothetical protein
VRETGLARSISHITEPDMTRNRDPYVRETRNGRNPRFIDLACQFWVALEKYAGLVVLRNSVESVALRRTVLLGYANHQCSISGLFDSTNEQALNEK